MSGSGASPRARPWVALLLPPVAWMLFEYGVAGSLRPACSAVGSWLGPVWGGASLIACAVAALIAGPLARASTDDAPRPWLGRLAMIGAGIFAMAIGFQTLATLIVPSCAR